MEDLDLRDLEGLRIGLAGGSSPLGQDVREELIARGAEVVVFSRSLDLGSTSYDRIQSSGLTSLVNMVGGHRIARPDSSHKEILHFGTWLADQAVAAKIPLVHISSGSAGQNETSAGSLQQGFRRSSGNMDYRLAKKSLELYHQQLRLKMNSQIADLRLYSFAGPNFLKSADYLVPHLFRAVRSKTHIYVGGDDFLRCYSGRKEIVDAIVISIFSGFSAVTDIFSSMPLGKFEILESLRRTYDLDFSITHSTNAIEEYRGKPSSDLVGFFPRRSIDVINEAFELALNA